LEEIMPTKVFSLLTALLVISTNASAQDAKETRLLAAKDYRDKMQGAWLGQMIGVGWGMPTEFKWQGTIIPADKMPAWSSAMVNQQNNDDCYVEMTFLKTLADYGLDVSIRQAGLDFAKSQYPLWHANEAGRNNLRNGIAPPDSGHPKFNQHADDIDYQIESDFAGIISPGLPNQAISLGERFGHLMNYGDGVYAGQFVAAMYSTAFFESDIHQIVRHALACIPAESQYAEMVRDMLRWHAEQPNDWQRTWQFVEEKYRKNKEYSHGLCSRADGHSPDGKDFSIDAKLNGAYILMGLLYGNGDLEQTVTISCRCGQDSDCNPSNAAGILCTTLGAQRIPKKFTEKLDPKIKFSHTSYDLPDVYAISEKLAQQSVLRAGGTVKKNTEGEDVFAIPAQTPKPSALEKSYAPGPIAGDRYSPQEMSAK
jgi:hypothetical protein